MWGLNFFANRKGRHFCKYVIESSFTGVMYSIVGRTTSRTGSCIIRTMGYCRDHNVHTTNTDGQAMHFANRFFSDKEIVKYRHVLVPRYDDHPFLLCFDVVQ